MISLLVARVVVLQVDPEFVDAVEDFVAARAEIDFGANGGPVQHAGVPPTRLKQESLPAFLAMQFYRIPPSPRREYCNWGSCS